MSAIVIVLLWQLISVICHEAACGLSVNQLIN